MMKNLFLAFLILLGGCQLSMDLPEVPPVQEIPQLPPVFKQRPIAFE